MHSNLSQVCEIKITSIPTPKINAGIGLFWDDCTQSLYFSDFLATEQEMTIFRYDYNKKKLYSANIEGESVSPIYIYPVKGCQKNHNLFVVGLNGVKIVEWNKESKTARVVSTLFTVPSEYPNYRIGIGRPDPFGRLYTGIVTPLICGGPRNSSFYLYSKARGAQRLFGDLTATAGVVFNTKLEKAYHLNACESQLTEFDYNPKTGDICNYIY